MSNKSLKSKEKDVKSDLNGTLLAEIISNLVKSSSDKQHKCHIMARLGVNSEANVKTRIEELLERARSNKRSKDEDENDEKDDDCASLDSLCELHDSCLIDAEQQVTHKLETLADKLGTLTCYYIIVKYNHHNFNLFIDRNETDQSECFNRLDQEVVKKANSLEFLTSFDEFEALANFPHY